MEPGFRPGRLTQVYSILWQSPPSYILSSTIGLVFVKVPIFLLPQLSRQVRLPSKTRFPGPSPISNMYSTILLAGSPSICSSHWLWPSSVSNSIVGTSAVGERQVGKDFPTLAPPQISHLISHTSSPKVCPWTRRSRVLESFADTVLLAWNMSHILPRWICQLTSHIF